MAIFWDLPNFDQCKFYYFDAVDLGAADEGPHKTSAIPKTKEELIYDQHGWLFHASTLKKVQNGLMGISGAGFLAWLSIIV